MGPMNIGNVSKVSVASVKMIRRGRPGPEQ